MAKILIVEDSEEHRLIMKLWLKDEFEILEAVNCDQAYKQIILNRPDFMILDFHLPGEDGFQFLHRITKDLISLPPTILLTASLQDSLKRNAMALGAKMCLEKSQLNGDLLCEIIHNILEKKAA